MIKLRSWATPLTIGMFSLMAVTGILMFFHLESGFNKAAHEWLGWVMVTAVAGHIVVNVQAFKRYLTSSGRGRLIIAVCLLVLAASFVSLPGQQASVSPPVLAFQAILKAPLAKLEGITGHSAQQMQADLAAAGIVLPDENATVESVTANSRELQGKAIRVLFGN